MYGSQSKSALIFTIDQMKVQHYKEMEKMKEKLLEEKGKVKELEDKFGVTQRKKWDIRQRKWWLIWLSNNDTDAYEYLMKTIHKSLLYGKLDLLKKGKHRQLSKLKLELNHVHIRDKNMYDECVNIYGMKLNSANHWWNHGKPVVSQLETGYHNGDMVQTCRQTKEYLISCCEENEIKFKKSWSKIKFISLLINHNHDKTYEKVNPMDLSIEELKELIERKNAGSC
tara:strand:+ start:430 stop:1107 length:678 start_codon:yes stop_codon:yes gene_type:complete